jgi:signal transduction histidine kinase
VAPDDRGRVVLTVRDEGEGIPEDLLPGVLLPFYPQHRGRPGLGLPIAVKFATLLGGTLIVESPPGNGTEVRVTLPLDPNGA